MPSDLSYASVNIRLVAGFAAICGNDRTLTAAALAAINPRLVNFAMSPSISCEPFSYNLETGICNPHLIERPFFGL